MQDDDVAERGEQLACDWFEEQGWEIVERNWARRLGELDVVARRDEAWGEQPVVRLAFVEVKTRERSRGPLPELRVDATKRRKVATLAKLYLAEHRLRNVVARFDVVGVDLDTGEVRHYGAAFDGTGRLR